MEDEYFEGPETRGTQLLYGHNVYVADEDSVRARVADYTARIRSHVGPTADLRSRDINIGRRGDAGGLLFDLVALVTTLFYAVPTTRATLEWWRRLLRSDGLEDGLLSAAQDPESPPLAMSPDLAALIALRHVEGDDRGAARLVWWDEVIIDRFAVSWGDGLEQSPERLYFFLIDHTGDRTYVAMRADGVIVTEATTEMPGGWMEYQVERSPDLSDLVESLREQTRADKARMRRRTSA